MRRVRRMRRVIRVFRMLGVIGVVWLLTVVGLRILLLGHEIRSFQ
jgi:hypothetical protein